MKEREANLNGCEVLPKRISGPTAPLLQCNGGHGHRFDPWGPPSFASSDPDRPPLCRSEYQQASFYLSKWSSLSVQIYSASDVLGTVGCFVLFFPPPPSSSPSSSSFVLHLHNKQTWQCHRSPSPTRTSLGRRFSWKWTREWTPS